MNLWFHLPSWKLKSLKYKVWPFVLNIKLKNIKHVSLIVSSDLCNCSLKNTVFIFSCQKIGDSGSFQWKKDYNIKDKCLSIAKGTNCF